MFIVTMMDSSGCFVPNRIEAALLQSGVRGPSRQERQYHKLSLVDATSFVLMRKHHIRTAFAFDTHFAIAGFRFAQ